MLRLLLHTCFRHRRRFLISRAGDIPRPATYSGEGRRLSHRFRQKRRRAAAPPPLDPAVVDLAIAALPARFTPGDLAAATSAHRDPRLALPLLSWAASHPNPRRRPDAAAYLAGIKRLGAARLYPELHALSSLAFSVALPSPSPALHNALIYFYAEARMLSRAVGVYNLMRRHPSPAVRPTAHTYNLLFAALLGRGPNSYIHHLYMGTLRSLFRQMVDAGVPPDIFSLNAMVKGYVQSLHVNDALRVFHQMEDVYGCSPNEFTYSYLIHGLCSQGRTVNARQLFDEMRAKKMVPGEQACNSLAAALAMVGEVEEALWLMEEMGRMGRAADGISCRTVLEAVCRKHGAPETVRMVAELEEKGVVGRWAGRELRRWIEDGGLVEQERHGLRLQAPVCHQDFHQPWVHP